MAILAIYYKSRFWALEVHNGKSTPENPIRTKTKSILGNFMRGIDRAFPKLENASLTLIYGNKSVYWSENPTCTNFPESGKRFQASGMRAIDSPHKITPRNMILRKKFQNFSIFASIYTSIFPNQGQVSIFTLRECAQSIFRMILPLYRLFWQKNFRPRLVPKCYPRLL